MTGILALPGRIPDGGDRRSGFGGRIRVGKVDQLDQTPRRAFLFMPLAFAGLVALWYRRERPLDDPRRNGSGRGIKLVLFRDNGKRGETIQVNKIVKSDAEWQKELTPEEFAVARKKGTERAFTGRYWDNHESGHVSLRVLRQRPVPQRRKVRVRHRAGRASGLRPPKRT